MIELLLMLGIAFGPVTVTWAVLRGLRRISDARAGAVRRPRRGQAPVQPVPGPPVGASLDELVDELGRLERTYRRLESTPLPASDPRLREVALAYDATLRRCCDALDLPRPGPPPLQGLDRLEVEATLAQHGLSW